jgi:predicted ATPase
MRRLVIKNFGPISDVDIEMKKYNFFIGGQGVGKSTIAKVFCLVTNYEFYLCPQQYLQKLWDEAMKDYDISSFNKSKTNISYIEDGIYHEEDDNDKEHKYSLSFIYDGSKCTTETTKDGVVVSSMDTKIDIILDLVQTKNSLESLKKIVDIEDKKDLKSALNTYFIDRFRDTMYIPADRIIYSLIPNLLPALNIAGSSIPKNVLYFALEYNKAKENMKKYEIPQLRVRFNHDKDDDFIVNSDGSKTSMTAASSGMQSAIPLMMTFENAIQKENYHGYVIEEPECNLYPTNQLCLMDMIITCMHRPEASKVSLTITTHSPYIINYLNVMIRRNAKNIDKPALMADNMTAYYITEDGKAQNLVSKTNDTGEIVINTFDLSETMSNIYDEYKSLG